MTNIKLKVTGARACATVNGVLTGGMIGVPVTIEYDDAWNGLTKNLVCRCGQWGPDRGETRTILNIEQSARVAHEVMKPGNTLYLGVEGYNADGTLVMPTTWAECGKIQHGANTNADPSASPRLAIWAQLQTDIAQLKQNCVDEEQIDIAIEAYLKQNPIEIPNAPQNCYLTVETITVGEDTNEPVAVTGITLDYTSLPLKVGDMMQLAAMVTPSNATNSAVTWETSASSVATVQDGLVTAIAEGNATITARSVENNTITATCAVSVAATESGGDDTGGDTPVYFKDSPYALVEGSLMKPTGATAAISSAGYLAIPYTDGITIATCMNAGWNTNTYPHFVVLDSETYTPILGEATGAEVRTGTAQYIATFTGYSDGAVIYANIAERIYMQSDQNGSNDVDSTTLYYYIIPGGAN